jgi:hypothetical protein
MNLAPPVYGCVSRKSAAPETVHREESKSTKSGEQATMFADLLSSFVLCLAFFVSSWLSEQAWRFT